MTTTQLTTSPVETSDAAPGASKPKEEYEEQTLTIEAAGVRLTVIMQSFPERLIHADKFQQYLAAEILKVYWAANSVKQYRKCIL